MVMLLLYGFTDFRSSYLVKIAAHMDILKDDIQIMAEILCISTNNLTESGKIGIIGAQGNKNKTKQEDKKQIKSTANKTITAHERKRK
jgi:hypothetical protein